MTYAPPDLITCRRYLLDTLDMHPGRSVPADLDPDEVGIVGDPRHEKSGGYHIGNDGLARAGRLTTDYSKRESPRDRPGSNAASALDIGEFDVIREGRRLTLPGLTTFLMAACVTGDPRARDLREIIGAPDGKTVRHWDRLGTQKGTSRDHLWHTHGSFFRDSEGRRARDDNFLGLLKAYVEGETDMTPDQEAILRRILALAENAERVATTLVSSPGPDEPLRTPFGIDFPGADDLTWRNPFQELLDRTVPVTLTDADRAAITTAVTTAAGARLAALETKLDAVLTRLAAAGGALDG